MKIRSKIYYGVTAHKSHYYIYIIYSRNNTQEFSIKLPYVSIVKYEYSNSKSRTDLLKLYSSYTMLTNDLKYFIYSGDLITNKKKIIDRTVKIISLYSDILDLLAEITVKINNRKYGISIDSLAILPDNNPKYKGNVSFRESTPMIASEIYGNYVGNPVEYNYIKIRGKARSKRIKKILENNDKISKEIDKIRSKQVDGIIENINKAKEKYTVDLITNKIKRYDDSKFKIIKKSFIDEYLNTSKKYLMNILKELDNPETIWPMN